MQDTLERAWKARATFIDGSNLEAWMFRILRNRIIDTVRKDRRFVEDIDGVAASQLVTHLDQHAIPEHADLSKVLDTLPPEMRMALLLTGIGLTDAEVAAAICIPLGTAKSYVHRGRAKLKLAGL